MRTPKTLLVLALSAGTLAATATGATAGWGGYDGGRDRLKTVSYINGDGGKNADVDPNSSCAKPDQYDMQQFSDPTIAGPGNNNVHNDACFLDSNGNKVGKGIGATFQSSGVGFISACPDPDGAGPEFSRLRDLNGDGRNDSCFQSSYQETGKAGDFEYHARLNNNNMAGSQDVKWGRDDDGDGRIDNRDGDDIKVDWSATGMTASSYGW